jgi:hypothetical protein
MDEQSWQKNAERGSSRSVLGAGSEATGRGVSPVDMTLLHCIRPLAPGCGCEFIALSGYHRKYAVRIQSLPASSRMQPTPTKILIASPACSMPVIED